MNLPLKNPRDRLKQKIKALEYELSFIKQVPSHPRDQLRRKVIALEDEVKFVKQVPSHPRNRFK